MPFDSLNKARKTGNLWISRTNTSRMLGICRLVVKYEPQHFVARYVGVRASPTTYIFKES
jgi:hypothetical protein